MAHRTNKLIRLVKNLIFVPTCASCDERLSPIPEKGNLTYDRICFCKGCGEKWEKAKVEMCPRCYNVSGKCTCTPDFFFKYQPDIPSLCYYHPESNDVQSKAIITMKRKNNTELFEFMAIELYPKLKSTLDKMGIDGRDCIFTWVPRSNASIIKSGFDQGKKLSQALSRLFRSRSYQLFLRVGGKEQKKLDKNQRKKNARKSIRLNHAMLRLPLRFKEPDLINFVRDKNVVIVDDVLTSGSTLRQAVELLNTAGAKNTVVVCIAKTFGKNAEKKGT